MYRNRRYNRRDKWPGLFEALAEIIITAGFLLGKLVYKLIRFIFSRIKARQSYKFQETTIDSHIYSAETPTETRTQVIGDSRYTLKQSLLTDAEKEFLKILEQIVGDRYQIESQVQLSRIVGVVDSSGRYTNYHDFNVIKAKSIDFVLYDNKFRPHLAIELDDRSHLRWDRIKRDQIVNEIMNNVGLRIIHVPTSYSYDIEGLRRNIFDITA